MRHQPVLVQELLSLFTDHSLQVVVDGTLGVGGHSKALLDSHAEIKHLIGIDRDGEAIAEAKALLSPYGDRITFIRGNFRDMRKELAQRDIHAVDAIILDIGLSSLQLDTPSRGFSFSKEGELDMRMDRRQQLTAKELINSCSEQELADLFFRFGEERRSRSLARALVARREKSLFSTTTELAAFVASKIGGQGTIHPATRLFQALRIAVNDELAALEEVMEESLSILKKGGICGVITFHSLEDRIVKRFIQQYDGRTVEGVKRIKKLASLTKKPLVAAQEELVVNRRARSAKLRGFVKWV